jgi:hypothetical protein
LINPQGVIVANYMWGNDLDRILDFYLTNEPPAMGIDGCVELHEDGRSVSIIANVMNHGMGDVNVRFSVYLDRLQWDENNVVYGSEEIAGSPISETAAVSFDEFCLTSHEFVIEPDEDWHTLSGSLWLEVPGGEDLSGREDRGYEILYSLDEFRLLDLVHVNGQWVVQTE